MRTDVDKRAVQADYLRGGSARTLAVKYGVSKSTVGRWARQYGWLRQSDPDFPAPTGGESGTHDYETMREFAAKLLQKADQLLERDEGMGPRELKSLSGVLLDARTLLNALSPREAAAQELKLQGMQKALEETQSESGGEIVVRFVDTEGAEQ